MATCPHCGCDPIQYALAQTEIKGHMRVKDDLQVELDAHKTVIGLLFNSLPECPRMGDLPEYVDDLKVRIAKLEKDWETDADYVRMAERIKELEKLLSEAMENLIWCGGSADFGWGGKAQVGYDKGPRTTIAAIHAALKSRA